MLNNLKALVIVMTLGLGVWWLARPFCLRAMSADDFKRRRTVWIAITLCVFTIPNFWLFCFLVILILAWALREEKNPLALYLLILYAAPHVHLYIPVVGINQLFAMSYQRLLAFCLLIPALLRMRSQADPRAQRELQMADFFVIGYCALEVILWTPHESMTTTARHAFLLFLDIVLPYLAFSRAITSTKSLAEGMYCFVLGAAILAPIALFESLRNWMLYVIVAAGWGDTQVFAFLFRAGALRAQATAGHALGLGYIMAIAFGFWMYLQRDEPSKIRLLGVSVLLWVGLFAAYSRGPWIVAIVIMFTYFLLMPKGISRTFKAGFAALAVGGILLLTPLGDRLITALPFVGDVDKETVTYREDLFETTLRLIPANPWFGDRFVMSKMEHLRQGQGIVDMVNGYVVVVLFYGIVGLFLITMFLLVPMWKGFKAARASRTAPEISALGLNLVACMIGSLLFIGMTRFELMMYVMCGMLIAYSVAVKKEMNTARETSPDAARPRPGSRQLRPIENLKSPRGIRESGH